MSAGIETTGRDHVHLAKRTTGIAAEQRSGRLTSSLPLRLCAGLLPLLVACTRSESIEQAAGATTREGLSEAATRTYGFESLQDWSPIYSSPALALSNTHSEGLKSLSVAGGGWSSIISRKLSKEGAPKVVGFDLRIPASQPNPFWYGTVQLFVDIPSRGINSRPLGLKELAAWTPGQWKRAEFAVPADVQSALARTYSDLRWRVELNRPSASTAGYLFDRFTLGPTAPTCVPTSDNNPCTSDICDANGQVQNVPVPAGTSCADASLCNGAETCNASGVCQPGNPPLIDDGNVCTTDSCDPTKGVIHAPVAAGSSCSDGDACNGQERCDATGTCLAGAPIVCVAVDDCHVPGVCDSTSGACSTPVKPDGTACTDSDACTLADSCQGGVCTPQDEVVCVVTSVCRVAGSCDSQTGECAEQPAPDGTPCKDADACTGAATCSAGFCPPGLPVDVDDGNPCTSDACDPVAGVTHAPLPKGTSCGDGDVCNGDEVCTAAGSCAPSLPVYVDDGNPCTVDYCDAELGVKHETAPECETLPPDPVAVAPPVPLQIATTVFDSTRFLYEGPNPIQQGVLAGTILPARVAVLRGSVQTPDGAPLAGVVVQIFDHPEYGFTQTREDGAFDLAVNGGGTIVVDFRRPDLLPAHRRVSPPWQGFAEVAELAMIAPDTESTEIDLTSVDEIQIAQGSIVEDKWGERRTTMLFAPGTVASFVRPDGEKIPLPTLTVRATEYTVGDNGPTTMPAELPPQSAYTKAFELSVDEANAQNAEEVIFSQPVITYSENFLGFPPGIPVPLGYYDRARATWVASENGVILKIVGIDGNTAVVSLSADDSPATPEELAAHDITSAELVTLATLYQPGQSLWRMPIPHFTVWDSNWGWGPPDGAVPPNSEPPCPDGKCEPPAGPMDGFGPSPAGPGGGNLNCSSQVVTQSVSVAGTPLSLTYSSANVTGYKPSHSVALRVTNETVPSVLKRIVVETHIAGKVQRDYFEPASNLVHNVEWDRRDAYDREVTGQLPALVRVGYTYEGTYAIPPRFGYAGNGEMISSDAPNAPWTGRMPPIVFWKEHHLKAAGVDRFESRDALQQGMGGWTLSNHHFYDPVGRVLHLGTGARIDQNDVPGGTRVNVNRINCAGCAPLADDVSIHDVSLGGGWDVAALPDGGLLYSEGTKIWRTNAAGILRRFAGGGTSTIADGVPARDVRLEYAIAPAAMPDGTVVFSHGHTVLSVDQGGILRVLAGGPVAGFSGDDGPAKDALFNTIEDLVVASDQSIYLADDGNNRVRRITAEGLVETVAGDGTRQESGDGGPARLAALTGALALAAAPDGAIFVATYPDGYRSARRIRRIGPDGIIETYAGGCDDWRCTTGPGRDANGTTIQGFAGMGFGPDGKLYFSQSGYYPVGPNATAGNVWRINASGKLEQVIGGMGQGRHCPDSRPAIPSCFSNIGRLDLAVDGTLYVLNNNYWDGQTAYYGTGIVSTKPQLPGFSNELIVVPSPDGDEQFVFDRNGRHLQTVSALTAAPRYNFQYDARGLLVGFEDGDGRTTELKRATTGALEWIESPDGQRTTVTLDADGYLASLRDPSDRTVLLQHDSGGLLTSITDGRGGGYEFGYDSMGRATSTLDAADAPNDLQRMPIETSSGQIIGHSVVRTGGEGRTKTYSFRQEPSGDAEYADSTPGTGTNRTVVGPSGGQWTQMSDNSTSSMARGPDGISGAFDAPQSFSVSTPSGLTQSWKVQKYAERAGSGTLVNATIDGRLNDRQYLSTYDAASSRWTHRSPLGRRMFETIDDQERVIESELEGLLPVHMTYEGGKLRFIRQGAGASERVTELTYEAGFVKTIRDALGRTTTFTRDPSGRVELELLPDAFSIAYGYNQNGLLSRVTPPGREPHELNYTPVDLLQSYVPPVLDDVPAPATSYEYDRERNLKKTIRPDALETSIVYDSANRPTQMTLPASGDVASETITYGYSPATGQLTSIVRSSGVGITLKNDGFLVTEESVGGLRATPIVLTRGFDGDFRRAFERVDGAHEATFVYDADGLLTRAGQLTLVPDPQHGLLARTTLGQVTDAWTYDAFGEPTSYVARFASAELYRVDFAPRDKLGRITQQTETILGETTTWAYEYDLSGRLTDVARNGSFWSHYDYDANGNRRAAEVWWPAPRTIEASYDAQDRLESYGDIDFKHTLNGELRTKTEAGQTTTYTYDALGALRRVTLPNTTKIEYLVDGTGRRVGKKVNGELVQAFVFESRLAPAAELDGAGYVVSRFVYGTRINVPEYMVKGGTTYRILTDHLGSPRLVVDATSGVVAQRMDFDEWGNVMRDTNPGFQPFGFAGGSYEPGTKLTKFGARDYDAGVGRWTRKDLLLGPNRLTYANSDPVNNIDLDGNASCQYSIGAHSMICDNGNGFSSTDFHSGNNLPGCKEGRCKDNPRAEDEKFRGPIPIGEWIIEDDFVRGNGRPAFRLRPKNLATVSIPGERDNDFLIHWCKDPGWDNGRDKACSEGCITTSQRTYEELSHYIKTAGQNVSLAVVP